MFGAVKLTKNNDPDKYSYSRYSIGFNSHSLFSIPNFDWSKNVIIFEVANSSSVHIDDKRKIYNKRLDDTIVTAEPKYSLNFTRSRRKFCLSLHYNGNNSFY